MAVPPLWLISLNVVVPAAFGISAAADLVADLPQRDFRLYERMAARSRFVHATWRCSSWRLLVAIAVVATALAPWFFSRRGVAT